MSGTKTSTPFTESEAVANFLANANGMLGQHHWSVAMLIGQTLLW